VAEWAKAADRGKVEVDKAEVAWAVPLREALAEPACARNAGTVNRMNVESPAYRSSVRSAVLR